MNEHEKQRLRDLHAAHQAVLNVVYQEKSAWLCANWDIFVESICYVDWDNIDFSVREEALDLLPLFIDGVRTDGIGIYASTQRGTLELYVELDGSSAGEESASKLVLYLARRSMTAITQLREWAVRANDIHYIYLTDPVRIMAVLAEAEREE